MSYSHIAKTDLLQPKSGANIIIMKIVIWCLLISIAVSCIVSFFLIMENFSLIGDFENSLIVDMFDLTRREYYEDFCPTLNCIIYSLNLLYLALLFVFFITFNGALKRKHEEHTSPSIMSTIEKEFSKLDQLMSSGMITEFEYTELRKKIISKI
jgi:glucan phosphoethanolaminetransferase (alkaline phosphatase superfamily)